MARNKSPRKRKTCKSGASHAATRISHRVYPKRFLVSAPPEHKYGDPAEFFYDTPEEAIQHCIHLGPQFFLDTQYYPPRVTIIRGFEQHNGHADEAGYDCIEGAMTESMPAEQFITGTELVSSALKVIRTERVKKACTKCDCIVEAPAPSRQIERDTAGPGYLPAC